MVCSDVSLCIFFCAKLTVMLTCRAPLMLWAVCMRVLRASYCACSMQSLAPYHVLGEYCGVVKSLAQAEVDAAAACAPDEQLTGFIIKDKTETFDTDIELPDAHSVRRLVRGSL